MTVSAVLYGLVLAGGRSARMQRDKAALSYRQSTQLEAAMALLTPHVTQAFVSARPDQADEPLRARFPRILDRHSDIGPLAGILAAQAEHPDAAWLVLACDLPYLDRATLEHLIQARQPGRPATAYRSSSDGMPEPLCAIYEPASGPLLLAHLASGKTCPRKFLIRAEAALLDLPNPSVLANINTPDEYAATVRELTAPKQITVNYYAILREQAGRAEESMTTAARTPRELYDELRVRHPFSLAPETLRVAVNLEFGDWSQPLAEGDCVVFIPPVAGG